METLHVAICEDKLEERQTIFDILDSSRFDVEVSLFSCGEDFLKSFKPYKFGLIFMDIYMKDFTGIDVITRVRDVDQEVSVAFVTSSQDFTLESYRLNAVKYIEKPADKKSVEDAIQMALLRCQTIEKLEIRINNVPKFIPLSQILYLEQNARNLLIFLRNGEVLTANKKLIDVEEQLVRSDFLRCHKSYLVNLAHIRGINRELCVFEMVDKSKVYIRKRSLRENQKAFESYLFKTQRGGIL